MAFYDETFSSQQLFSARDYAWTQIFSFINSMSLKCAIDLGIFDIIHKHGKPITLSELIHALPINEQKSYGVDRLMRILVHSKFCVKVSISNNEENEGYWLTPSSRILVKEDPMSIEPFIVAMLDPLVVNSFHHLGEWFKDDAPTPCVSAHGKSFWDFLENDQRWIGLFKKAMAGESRFVASVVSRDLKHVFEGVKSIVDVGGGIGILAKVFGDSFPGLKCTVLDLPHVVAGLEGTDNLTFVGGDMFVSVPPADAVFLRCLLHDWSDEDCVNILKKCKEAIPSKENGGKVIIVDMVVPDDDDDEKKKDNVATGTIYKIDILMLSLVNGKERNEKQWKQLFESAGFTSYKISPNCLGVTSLIELFP